MLTRTFDARPFLRSVYGTEPFVEYCQSRQVRLEQVVGFAMRDEDYHRWQAAVKALPESAQARIALELSQVAELANEGAAALLLAGATGDGLPSEAVPDEAALALFFFLRHPTLFREVFLRHEIEDVDAWRVAQAPAGIVPTDLARAQESLAATLADFYRAREGTGRFCVVDAYRVRDAFCFVAHLSDRLHLFEVFTDEGRHTTHRARPAFPLVFVYYPADGRLLVKARQRARERILELFQRFGRAVLGIDLDEACLAPAFRLDLFKRRFDPPRDADMALVRVRALHCLYPEREGRRRVKLETLAGDSPFAILDLLREHGGGDAVLEQLTVSYVELEVRYAGGEARKPAVIRLWRDRCSLHETAHGERLRAYLQRWGVYAR